LPTCRALLDRTAEGGCLHLQIPLLDFSVGKRFQLFDDLLQPPTALGVILLGWQGTSLLGIFLVEPLNVADLGFQRVDTAQDRFSSI